MRCCAGWDVLRYSCVLLERGLRKFHSTGGVREVLETQARYEVVNICVSVGTYDTDGVTWFIPPLTALKIVRLL